MPGPPPLPPSFPSRLLSHPAGARSFGKAPAYWRVVGVVPGSPADAADVERGGVVTRINGEAVAQWPARRYEQLLANAENITVTFLNGSRETEKRLKVGELGA